MKKLKKVTQQDSKHAFVALSAMFSDKRNAKKRKQLKGDSQPGDTENEC